MAKKKKIVFSDDEDSSDHNCVVIEEVPETPKPPVEEPTDLRGQRL